MGCYSNIEARCLACCTTEQNPLQIVELDKMGFLPTFKQFENKSDMQRHAKEVHRLDEKGHKCPKCFKSFPTSQQLQQHSLVHSNVRKYHCQFCDKSFKQLSHVQQHQRTHTGERPYKCTVESCDKAFAQLANLQHHMKNHDVQIEKSDKKPWNCQVCDRRFATEASLNNHIAKLHATLARPHDLTCQVCEKQCYNIETFYKHIHRHHPEYWRVFAGGRPLADFINPKDVKQRDKPYTCEVCQKQYSHETGLMKHLATHPESSSNLKMQLYTCSVCKKFFTKESYLLRHMEMKLDPDHSAAFRVAQEKFRRAETVSAPGHDSSSDPGEGTSEKHKSPSRPSHDPSSSSIPPESESPIIPNKPPRSTPDYTVSQHPLASNGAPRRGSGFVGFAPLDFEKRQAVARQDSSSTSPVEPRTSVTPSETDRSPRNTPVRSPMKYSPPAPGSMNSQLPVVPGRRMSSSNPHTHLPPDPIRRMSSSEHDRIGMLDTDRHPHLMELQQLVNSEREARGLHQLVQNERESRGIQQLVHNEREARELHELVQNEREARGLQELIQHEREVRGHHDLLHNERDARQLLHNDRDSRGLQHLVSSERDVRGLQPLVPGEREAPHMYGGGSGAGPPGLEIGGHRLYSPLSPSPNNDQGRPLPHDPLSPRPHIPLHPHAPIPSIQQAFIPETQRLEQQAANALEYLSRSFPHFR